MLVIIHKNASSCIIFEKYCYSSRLILAGCFKDHFTHIFLDEAGHAVEPEALIPISGLLPRSGQLVMAGDPKQLGPVLRSPVSKSNGLGELCM